MPNVLLIGLRYLLVAVIFALLVISLYTLAYPIEHLAEAIERAGGRWLVQTADMFSAVVILARERFSALVGLGSDSPYYRWIDSFLVFDVAILLWMFGIPLTERDSLSE